MKRPGPPKTPTKLAALRGFPGHQRRNKREPQPSTLQSIDPPARIADDPVAVEEWHARAAEYVRIGTLTVVSAPALARACRWLSVYRDADAQLAKGMTITTKNNGEQVSPFVGIALKAHAAADAILSRFGETPADLTRIVAPEPEAPEDPMEKLLRDRESRRSA